MKVTLLLRNEHDALETMLTHLKMRSKVNSGRNELLQQIRQHALLHSKMETDIFYPALAATASDRAPGLVSVAKKGHQTVEQLLLEMTEMDSSKRDFEVKLGMLSDEIHRHIRTDEEEIFREARKSLSEPRLEELGIVMQRRRNLFARCPV